VLIRISEKVKNLFNIGLFFFIAFYSSVSLADSLLPTLDSLSISSTNVDATSGEQVVTINFQATDNIGIDNVVITFNNPSGNLWETQTFLPATVTPVNSGSLEFTVPAFAAEGDYELIKISVTDAAGNSQNYNVNDLTLLGFPTLFNVVNDNADLLLPTLDSLSITPANVNASTGQQSVSVNFQVTDNIGVDFVGVVFYNPAGDSWESKIFWFNTLNPVNTGTLNFMVSAFAAEGDYSLVSISITDMAGNNKWYTANDLQSLGFPTLFNVINTNADSILPTLDSLSITPAIIDVTSNEQLVTVNFQVTDNIGIEFVGVVFDDPAGNSWKTQVFLPDTDTPTPINTGLLEFTVPVLSTEGDYSIFAISVTDIVGNNQWYTTDDLISLGFPTKFKVTIDTDGDSVEDINDNCPLISNTDQANTDGDGLGDSCDPDDDNDGVLDTTDKFPLDATESIDTDNDGTGNNADDDDDGDGIPDEVEDDAGLNPLNKDDALLDLDNDGKNNLQEFIDGTDINIDDVPPAFIAPDDLFLNSTGVLTAVNLAQIEVVDSKDGILFAAADKQGPFSSGQHQIIWTVSDNMGNTTQDVQLINIKPLVELDIDKLIGEGQTTLLTFTLNGSALQYPVLVNYTISGSSDSNDHNAIDGTLTINDGKAGYLEVNIFDDNIDELSETLVITLVSATHAVLPVNLKQTITIVADSIAPISSLSVMQNSKQTLNIIKTQGEVKIISSVRDPNVGETHSYDWSLTDNNLVDSDTDNSTFSFDPLSLNSGLYEVALQVTDQTGLSSSVLLWVNVLDVETSLSSSDDMDNDGILDAYEGATDSDGDGIADYLDDIAQAKNILPLPNGKIMQVANGLVLKIGQSAFGGNSVTATTTMSDIDSYGGAVAGVSSIHIGFAAISSIFDFIIEGLAQPGDVASLVIGLESPLPENAVYRKFLPQTGWISLVAGNGYNIESAKSDSGVCPDVGSSLYMDELTAGDDCIRLTLVDGGEYDGDGVVNGIIEDPAVIAVATEPPVLSEVPDISIVENGVLHLNSNDAELVQYVTDMDTDVTDIQFSILNADSIDSRFGISIGMEGVSFMDRSDNSIHSHPVDGFSGTTLVQLQAKDLENNLSNVITFSFTITALPSTKETSSGGGVFNFWMILVLLFLSIFYAQLSRFRAGLVFSNIAT